MGLTKFSIDVCLEPEWGMNETCIGGKMFQIMYEYNMDFHIEIIVVQYLKLSSIATSMIYF